MSELEKKLHHGIHHLMIALGELSGMGCCRPNVRTIILIRLRQIAESAADVGMEMDGAEISQASKNLFLNTAAALETMWREVDLELANRN